MGTLALAFEIPGLNWTQHRFEGMDGNYKSGFVYWYVVKEEEHSRDLDCGTSRSDVAVIGGRCCEH